MTALTGARDTARKEDEREGYPVKADAKIFQGGMVCVGADGYAVAASDSAGLKFVGMALGSVDATGKASAALVVEVRRTGVFKYNSGQDMTAQTGALVYVVDDQTVDLGNVTTNDVLVGVISKVENATEVWIDTERRA